MVSRLDGYVRGWGEYFKRAEVTGCSTGTIAGSRGGCEPSWRSGDATGFWLQYPDQWFWLHLGLTRLYHLRRNFIRALAARRGADNRPVERSAGNPHATFVRGTEALS